MLDIWFEAPKSMIQATKSKEHGKALGLLPNYAVETLEIPNDGI